MHEAEPPALYAAVRSRVGAGSALAVLHVGAQSTWLAAGTGAAAHDQWTLAAGWLRTARECGFDAPPTSRQVETAIHAIEETLMRSGAALAQDCPVYALDPALRELAVTARLAQGEPGRAILLDVEDVERAFTRLARVVQGRPAAHEGLPESPAFAARLLILRELMNHVPFSPLTLLV